MTIWTSTKFFTNVPENESEPSPILVLVPAIEGALGVVVVGVVVVMAPLLTPTLLSSWVLLDFLGFQDDFFCTGVGAGVSIAAFKAVNTVPDPDPVPSPSPPVPLSTLLLLLPSVVGFVTT